MVREYEQALLSTEEADDKSRKGFNGKQVQWLLLASSFLLAMMLAVFFVTPSVIQIQMGARTQFYSATSVISKNTSQKYYWPHARGNVGSYGKSPYAANIPIETPTWSWSYQCCFMCTWCTITNGVLLDGEKYIYHSAADGIRKFSPTGQLLWRSHRVHHEGMSKVATLMDGVAYAISEIGRVFAISMDTGKQLWSTKVASSSDGNYGSIAAEHGVVIVAAGDEVDVNLKVFGLNSTDGSLLWTYAPDVGVWNFGATFPGDGTFIYQTLDGKVYRNFVSNGTLVWKSGGVPGTWTDGQCNLGSNGIVYGVGNYGLREYYGVVDFSGGINGHVSAHRLSDGSMIWRKNVTWAPNSIPAVGMLSGQTKMSVVAPTGLNDNVGSVINVHAFDAETGEDQWVFHGPAQKKAIVGTGAGDSHSEAIAQRLFNRVGPVTLPNSWGTPVIDGNGVVFVGGITGNLFRLQDSNGDGEVFGPDEVANLTTDADFVGCSSPAIAPGLFAVGNSHSLFVWNY